MDTAINVKLLQDKIRAELEKLKIEQETLTKDMELLVNQTPFLNDQIANLKKFIPALNSMKKDAVELVDTIKDISISSENISSKIRTLDTARNRVNECQSRVCDLIDLEICSQGVQAAILDSDYEKGAAHVHRFLSMDQSVLQKSDVESVNTLKSVRTLQDAANQLGAIVEHKFNEAVKNEDLLSIERFFKLFPLIGMHETGIREFCTYLRTKVSSTAEKNLKFAMTAPATADKRFSVIYADNLTLLFEGLAKVIDVHYPLLETYYRAGWLYMAVDILQKECDIQVKRIFNEWLKTRQINKKMLDITEQNRGSSSKLVRMDPKDLDILIGEITLMHYRIELYIRFIQRKVWADLDLGVSDVENQEKIKKSFLQMINNSELTSLKHELLSFYLRFEQYFMEESVAKAVGMDSIDSLQQTSSMVDDTFFIIRKCIRRSISSGNLDGICAIINNACRVLENDFCDILKSKLKQGYPSGYLDLTQAYNVLQTSIQQGRLQSSDTEQSRIAFVVALNNADSSIEYVDALCEGVLKEIEQALPNMSANEKGKLDSCLSGLSSVTFSLKEIIDYGIQQLHSSVIKPRVHPWVDSFYNFNHQLTEDELSVYEAGEQFVQTLIMNLESLLSSFKEALTTSNYDAFVSALTTEVTQRLEKVILKSSFNGLGGLVLDKEVRALASYITAATSWSVRDKFARLTQIATVLNLEQVSEIADYWGNHDGALTWRLTPSELKTFMLLRTDFKADDVKKLKL